MIKPPPHIRAATLMDAQYLPDIERSAAQLFKVDPELAWLADGDVQSCEAHIAFIQTQTAWVATVDHQLVGFINGTIHGQQCHIHELSVHKDHQGQGIGRALIEALEAAMIDQKIQTLTLTTFKDLPWNAPFYQRLGFKIIEAPEHSTFLRAIFDEEKAAGLMINRRCAMFKNLD